MTIQVVLEAATTKGHILKFGLEFSVVYFLQKRRHEKNLKGWIYLLP